jgi:FkbM family methyltransferase
MESTKLGKYIVIYPNKREYHLLKREIWNQEIYNFNSKKITPFIIDIGSHIGISILYFKSKYPDSKILSFEPNPISFEILEENIQNNGLKDITLVNRAISSNDCIKTLYIDNTNENWNSNSSLLEKSWSGRENSKPINVSCTRLDAYLEDIQAIDMLKIDTEGTEFEILNSHKNILNRVENISVEYHPNKRNKVEKIIAILNPHFQLEIYYEGEQIKKVIDGKLLTIKGKKRV